MIRSPILRTIAPLVMLAGLTVTAEAHRLKLFATVEDGVVHGYGFFIGGGRPSEAQLVIRDAQGVELFRGPAAADGSFTFKPAVASDLALTIDAGDGHAAETHISAARFPQSGTLDPVGAASAAAPSPTTPKLAPEGASPTNLNPSEKELALLVDRSIDRAVSRQLAPLLEAYAEADGRARFSDIVSGIAVIFGMAGLFLWGRSRRRSHNPPPDAP